MPHSRARRATNTQSCCSEDTHNSLKMTETSGSIHTAHDRLERHTLPLQTLAFHTPAAPPPLALPRALAHPTRHDTTPARNGEVLRIRPRSVIDHS